MKHLKAFIMGWLLAVGFFTNLICMLRSAVGTISGTPAVHQLDGQLKVTAFFNLCVLVGVGGGLINMAIDWLINPPDKKL